MIHWWGIQLSLKINAHGKSFLQDSDTRIQVYWYWWLKLLYHGRWMMNTVDFSVIGHQMLFCEGQKIILGITSGVESPLLSSPGFGKRDRRHLWSERSQQVLQFYTKSSCFACLPNFARIETAQFVRIEIAELCPVCIFDASLPLRMFLQTSWNSRVSSKDDSAVNQHKRLKNMIIHMEDLSRASFQRNSYF